MVSKWICRTGTGFYRQRLQLRFPKWTLKQSKGRSARQESKAAHAKEWYGDTTLTMTPPQCFITTSSAAQGGGRSFNNKKPKGEVGCCESRMAGQIH